MKKKWTIIMQVSAENNLFDEQLNVMQQLYGIKAGSDVFFPDINFIVIFDCIAGGKFSKDFARPSIYEVKPNSNFFLDFPRQHINGRRIRENLSSVRTLEAVYAFIKKTYPAEHFGYIYKGHGGAATGDIGSGAFFEKIIRIPKSISNNDDKIKTFVGKKIKGWSYSGSYPLRGYSKCNLSKLYVMVLFSRKNTGTLSYRQTAGVLGKVFDQQKLDFVFLDCCWGMQIENASTFSELTDYFIASADEMPAAGIGYTDLLKKITDRPEILGREIANLIISVFFTNKYDDYDSDVVEFRKMGVSLTNLRTADMSFFKQQFTVFCRYLHANLFKFSFLMKQARSRCCDYTYETPIEFAVYNIDLIWWLENLKYFNEQSISDIKLNEMIAELISILAVNLRYGFLGNNYKVAVPGHRALGGQGITITFPEARKDHKNSILNGENSQRPVFVTETGWDKLLLDYYGQVEKHAKKPHVFIKYYQDLQPDSLNFFKPYKTTKGRTSRILASKVKSFYTDKGQRGLQNKWDKVTLLPKKTVQRPDA